MVLFLHDLGYNFFNIGKLTFYEIELLVNAYKERNEQEKKHIEEEKRKSKNKKR